MNAKQRKRLRIEKQYNLIHDFSEIEQPTQKQKDLFLLQYMRYDIDRYSQFGRMGMIGALDRAIKRLKEGDK